MPLWKCRVCHHEWEWSTPHKCNWCEADEPILLEEETSFEKMVRWFIEATKLKAA